MLYSDEEKLKVIGFDAIILNEEFRDRSKITINQEFIKSAFDDGLVEDCHLVHILSLVQFDKDFIKEYLLDNLPHYKVWPSNTSVYNAWTCADIWEAFAKQIAIDEEIFLMALESLSSMDYDKDNIVDVFIKNALSRNINISEKFLIDYILNCEDESKYPVVKTTPKLILSTIIIHRKVSENFLELFEESLDWNHVLRYQDLSESFILKNYEKLDNDLISRFQKFSEDFFFENSGLINFDMRRMKNNDSLEWLNDENLLSDRLEVYLKLNEDY